MSDSAAPWTVTGQAPLVRFSRDSSPWDSPPWDSPGKNTGVGGHFLLHGIFLTQGLNPHPLYLLHW